MGFYLCIASNGIPPTVSKRYYIDVFCKYKYVKYTLQKNLLVTGELHLLLKYRNI